MSRALTRIRLIAMIIKKWEWLDQRLQTQSIGAACCCRS
jgi:hypothetical protein